MSPISKQKVSPEVSPPEKKETALSVEKVTEVSAPAEIIVKVEQTVEKKIPDKDKVVPEVVVVGNPAEQKKLEILYDGYYVDVTDFVHRHPGGKIIKLYVESGEDATIPINQFHFRSLDKVLGGIKKRKKRIPTEKEIGLDPPTRKRHEKLTADFLQLVEELKADGMFDPAPCRFFFRILEALTIMLVGAGIHFFLGGNPVIPFLPPEWQVVYLLGLPEVIEFYGIPPLLWRFLGILLISLGSGQLLWLGHEGGHNSFTGIPKFDKFIQSVGYGFVFGLSASSWNSTHSEHHAMPQHESKDADLKTLPLIAFSKKLVKDGKKPGFFVKYQHILFVLCDTFIVTMTWKWNHHLRFVISNGHWFDLACMMGHYGLVPILGFLDWLAITWLGSIYVLGNLILSHTHLGVVEDGRKLHWVEYAFLYTVNIRSSWWVDWFTGHLNYQIEHHLFPTMPEFKGKLCRDKVKEFAKSHDLPYHLVSYWEAVKATYQNLEHVAYELRHMM